MLNYSDGSFHDLVSFFLEYLFWKYYIWVTNTSVPDICIVLNHDFSHYFFIAVFDMKMLNNQKHLIFLVMVCPSLVVSMIRKCTISPIVTVVLFPCNGLGSFVVSSYNI
jgi:hypothetical protein